MIVKTYHKKSVGYYKKLAWRKKVKGYWRLQRGQKNNKFNIAKQYLSVFSETHLQEPTSAEIKFNEILKTLNLTYFRQPYFCKANSSYIPDFLFKYPYYLIVEVDGDYHKTQKQQLLDAKRDYAFALKGYKTIRFSNKDVFENSALVLNKLKYVLEQQQKWNSGRRVKDIFSGGVLEEIKRTKPAITTQDSEILAANPPL